MNFTRAPVRGFEFKGVGGVGGLSQGRSSPELATSSTMAIAEARMRQDALGTV